jgi:anti-sigma regulatory factor (Ser/Thr protein kinase)
MGLVAATGAAIISGPGTRLEYREFEPEPQAVPQARRYTRAVLRGWGTGEVADDAELIVSELVTNAVAGIAGLPCADRVGLLLAADDISLTVLVWDASTQLPVRRPADAQASAGRGLRIIEALSSRWGSCADRTGKVVWALLSLDPGR